MPPNFHRFHVDVVIVLYSFAYEALEGTDKRTSRAKLPWRQNKFPKSFAAMKILSFNVRLHNSKYER